MPLRERAVLEVSVGDTTAAFEFKDEFEQEISVSHNYLVGGRGQYLQEIWDVVDFDIGTEGAIPNRRAGYHVDGGAGRKSRTLSFATGKEPDGELLWGDGSGGNGSDNVTTTDASGAGVSKYDRADVFEYWIAECRTDSTIPGFLYYNQYSDGTYADSAGLHNNPLPVIVEEANISTDVDEPTAVSGQVTLVQTNILAEQGDILGEVSDALDEIRDDA